MKKCMTASLKKRKRQFSFYVIFLFVLAVSIILMPISSSMKETARIWLILNGFLFWTGILGTVFMAFRINHCRKKNDSFKQMYPNLKRLGFIHFFQNKPAIIFDITMFISIIGFILTKIFVEELILPFAFLALFVFSFGMHCMLNGIGYLYINYKVRGEDE